MKTFKSRKTSWAVVVQYFNPNTQKREAGQSGLQCEFQDSHRYIVKPYQEKEKEQKNKTLNSK